METVKSICKHKRAWKDAISFLHDNSAILPHVGTEDPDKSVHLCPLTESFELQHEKTFLVICVPNENLNQPARPRSLITVRCSYEETLSLAVQNTPFDDSDQTAQSDLNRHRAHMSKGTLSHVEAYLHQLTEKNPI